MFIFALLFVVSAQADDGPSDVSSCFPDCSPGYLCHDGACIEACNPSCGSGMRCTSERVCAASGPVVVAPAAVAAPVAPVPAGARLCVFRKFNVIGSALSWGVAIDGDRVGNVGAGGTRCFGVLAGRRELRINMPGWPRTSGLSATVVVPADGLQVDLKQRGGVVLDGTSPL